ncbi:hypothetical protein [Nocardia sp. NPDC005366]|uniref:hypothetical protein n=1 Tax=Nocardia sp. NPDC005366 TaxID=3156878 RepID=UPI0033B27E5F
MICPHCNANLLRKERGDRRCSKCRRVFALEPKESVLGLHDMRVRKLAERLGDGRNLRYTLPQLWYAASRRQLPDLRKKFIRRRLMVSVPIAVATFVLLLTALFPGMLVLGLGITALVLVNVLLTALRPRYMRTAPVRMPVSYDRFHKEVVGRWLQVYGAPPLGSVNERAELPPAPRSPRLALLCPDHGVLVCLSANNVAETWGMALASRIDRLPPEVPVLVLHDASVPGIAFAAQARAALGKRAVPVGLTPRALLGKDKALRLRDPVDSSVVDVARLRAEPLSNAEIAWLAEGWWSPLAAVPPAKLLAALTRAVERVEEAADPDRKRAREVGFLTWPTG